MAKRKKRLTRREKQYWAKKAQQIGLPAVAEQTGHSLDTVQRWVRDSQMPRFT